MRKRLLALVLSLVMVLAMLPATALAADPETIDFAKFAEEVEKGNGTYDGQGITVKWSPTSACTIASHATDRTGCLFPEGQDRPEADGNTPQRLQEPNVQYQMFSGEGNLSISNVNFVFEPADITYCANTGWKGSGTAEQFRNAEFQLLNTGDVSFTNCSFDKVIVSPYSSATKTSFTDCDFRNVYNAYTIKDVNAPEVTVTECTFENCSGGIYLEHNVARTNVTITNNVFTDMDQYAAAGKENTRGLIQFSAGSGDFTNAVITIAGNTSTDSAFVLRQLNPTIDCDAIADVIASGNNNFAAAEVFTADSRTGNIVLPDECVFTEGNTVFDGTNYYATLNDALKNVHQEDARTLWCKPGADVGSMTHGHVCYDLTVYGNGAYISGGERDFELDTYNAGHSDGQYLTQDVDLTVYNLDGAAVWGERHSEQTLNIHIQDCRNMNRVYISGTSGINNITLTDCTYDGAASKAYQKANQTALYSNASGTIRVENCTFTGVKEGVNLNHEVTDGSAQNVTIQNCSFKDCSTTDICDGDKLYAAPIRVVSKYNAVSNLTVDSCTFVYSNGKETCNGDILLGEGREGKVSTPVTATIINTAAQVQIQNPGDRTESQNLAKRISVEASATPTIISSAVAQVGDVKYTSLADAISNAASGSTITVLTDVQLADDTSFAINKQLHFVGADLDGKKPTITVHYTGTQGSKGLFAFQSGSAGSSIENLQINVTGAGAKRAYAVLFADYQDTEKQTVIRNVDFVGDADISNIGTQIGISSTNSTTGGNVLVTGCTFTNFCYGVYADNISNFVFDNNKIDGTKYNAINLGEDGGSNIQITNNIFTNISYANFVDPVYSSGITVGANVSDVTITGNSISMLNDKLPIYVVENTTTPQVTVTFKDGDTVFGMYLVPAGTHNLPAAPTKDGYVFQGWSDGKTTYQAEAAVEITADTTFTAQWSAISSGTTTYSVSVTSAANGKVTTSTTRASKGSTVTITVKPDEGYALDQLTVTDANGNAVSVTKVSDTKYTFKMPASKVTVKATFEKAELVSSLPFTDVDVDDWFYEAVEYVYDNGMMNGTTSTKFGPNAQLTRGMIVTILYRLENEPAVSGNDFVDVNPSQYYADPIAWAAKNGIVTGYGDGTFGPDKSITREQLAAILYRYASYKGYDVSKSADLSAYTDADSVSSYAKDAMAWANAEGLITGVTATTLNPTGTATRAQVATMLMRFCENIAK